MVTVEREMDKLMKLIGDAGKVPKGDFFCSRCGAPEEKMLNLGGTCPKKKYLNVTQSMLDRQGWLKKEHL